MTSPIVIFASSMALRNTRRRRYYQVAAIVKGVAMRLYDYGPSQNCFKVRLLASHLSLVLEAVPVSIFEGEASSTQFLAKNPMGTVPLLETDSGQYLNRMQSSHIWPKKHRTYRARRLPELRSYAG
jgi:Glutathione S-transferase, N-terminal domain